MVLVLGLILSLIIAFFYACTSNKILKVIFLLLVTLIVAISIIIDYFGVNELKSLMFDFPISKKNTFEDEKKIKVSKKFLREELKGFIFCYYLIFFIIYSYLIIITKFSNLTKGLLISVYFGVLVLFINDRK